MSIEPTEKLADTSSRQRHARISGTVVKIDGVTVSAQRVPARK